VVEQVLVELDRIQQHQELRIQVVEVVGVIVLVLLVLEEKELLY